MKHSLLTLVLVASCGNFSNEDLVFLAGVPRAHEVEMEVEEIEPGPATALVGDPAELYTSAYDTATDINGQVSEILSFVEQLGTGHPPTERTDDARIWGPIEDIDGKGITLRLEIRRDERDDGGPRFSFCVHAARDEVFDLDEVHCDTSVFGPLPAILAGRYEPRSAEEGIRSGSGLIVLNFEASQRAGTAKPEDRGVLSLEFDFDGGGEDKQIHLDFSRDESFTTPGQHAQYDYGRDPAGNTDFFLSFQQDRIEGADLETMMLEATWQEDGPGRGEVWLVGGDIPPEQSVTGTECWDLDHRRTYFRFDVEGDTSLSFSEGDIANCP